MEKVWKKHGKTSKKRVIDRPVAADRPLSANMACRGRLARLGAAPWPFERRTLATADLACRHFSFLLHSSDVSGHMTEGLFLVLFFEAWSHGRGG